MNIASLFLKLLEPCRRSFEKATADPVKAQEKILFEYLARNKDTEYGRLYKFGRIHSIRDYRNAVPLVDYETIRPQMDRMTAGEQNILTKDAPTFFGSTSGTTSLPKLIPTTKYSEMKKAQLLELWSSYIAKDHPDILQGKVLAIISPEIEGHTASGVRYGAESGHGYQNLPWAVKKLYALPPEVFDIVDYNARYYTILRISMEQNVTDVATLNPNTIVLLCQKIAQWQNAIIEDIRSGTLSNQFIITPATRTAIARTLRPNPRRAQELQRLLAEKGKLLPKDFWPHMQLIECWKGGMMRLYLKELETYFGNVPKRDIGCLSTEARCSIPLTDEGASGVLAIQTNFFEFIAKEDIAHGSKKTLLCNEIETGKEYFIIVTTAGGLYRYNIDDIVKVTGFYNKTPLIEFVQKGKGATSLAGEKLYESHVSEAVSKALEKTGLLIEFFCAVGRASSSGGLPYYDFMVEFSDPSPSNSSMKDFLVSVEEGLRKQDPGYTWSRNAQLLNSPVLMVIRKGDFEKYRLKKIANGAHDGQFKAPELTADQDFEKNFCIEKTIPFTER